MKFNTKISKITNDDMILRGEKLSSLIEKNSFSDTIFLMLAKRNPSKIESEIFSAMLISVIDHGMGTTSSMTARFAMSGGNSINTAIGAGILALGDFHGGAIENSMAQLKSIESKYNNDVSQFVKDTQVIYGFGHKIYKEKDPRVIQIISLCKNLGYESKYLDLAVDIEKKLFEKKGKSIPLNVDGLIAALLLEMKFSEVSGRAFFIIARTPGLAAQAIEEKETEKPVRRVDEEDINYLGDE
jgi:citryl-CoA lyase